VPITRKKATGSRYVHIDVLRGVVKRIFSVIFYAFLIVLGYVKLGQLEKRINPG
jgi:hypothetical protein